MRSFNVVLKKEIYNALKEKSLELDCEIEEIDSDIVESIIADVSVQVQWDYEVNNEGY